MLRILSLLVLAIPAWGDEPVTRKMLKPGLVATFDGVTRLEPTVAGSHAGTWSGYIQIVTPGEYTFTTPGSVSLKKDGRTFAGGKLEPGFYEFTATLPGRGELLWEGPGFQREPIPYFFFGHLPSQRPEKFGPDQKLDHGRFLFEELACAKCHKTDMKLAERTGPNLSKIGSRVFPGWLDAWLADPAKLRPHTTMPKMFADTEQGVAERYAVVQYLSSLGGPLVHVSLLDKFSSKSVEDGAKLFVSTGCAACHGPKLAGTMKLNEDDDEPPPFQPLDSIYGLGGNSQARYALGGIGSKTTVDELTKYLKDPLKTNPHGRMPAMGLSSDEARDLARHLIRFKDDSIKNTAGVNAPKMSAVQLAEQAHKGDAASFAKLKPAEQWKTLGQEIFASKGCVNCHAVDGFKLFTPKNESFAKLATTTDKGCLADGPKSVSYKLDESQHVALREFVKSGGGSAPSPMYETRAALKRFNCLNCHKKDGEGGLGSELAETMKKLESSGNEDDVQPPRLTGIGHKATTAWLQEVLLKGGKARPWMNLRMPQYGDANVGHLPIGLAACEGLPPDTAAATKPKASAAMINEGRKLAGKEGLGCVACHDISGFAGGGTRGPDLATTDKRVRHEWYGRWMHNPQRIVPGTKMPQNFTDGVSVSKILDGKPDAQIEALWTYFSLGPGLPLPTGIQPPGKALALEVKDRPEILRTFMPDGAGTRPIAVGYPGGGSFVFDSQANRITYAWEGHFLDVAPVWNARGGNAAKLLGPKFFTPPPGPTFAITDGKIPDFNKLAQDYAYGAPVPFQKIHSGPMRTHFHGYDLDKAGRPTFKYSVDDTAGQSTVSVAETPLPVKATIASGLERTFEIDGSKGKGTLWLQVASFTGKPRPIESGWILPQPGDKAVVVRLDPVAGAKWHVPDVKDGLAVLELPISEKKYPLKLTVWALPRDDDALLGALPVK